MASEWGIPAPNPAPCMGPGDESPPDDGPVKGVDWDHCAWCGEGAWLPPAASDDVLTETEHTVSDVDGHAYFRLPACPECVGSGRADTHPSEED